MADTPSLIRQFRLSNLAEEFTHYSQIEAERLQLADPNFDESLHKQAVELVLRKLQQHRGTRHDH
jgi:hypothetical protein